MPLDDLNKELYNLNSKIIPSRGHEASDYDPDIAGQQGVASPFDEQQQWQNPQKGLSPKQKKLIWIGLAVLLVIILAVAGFFTYRWWQKNVFHQDRVAVSFEGPSEVDSTQVTKYIIHYKNDNRVTLKNAEIDLTYSENFQPIDNVNLKYLSPSSSKVFVGDINPLSEGTIELKGSFYAPKDSPVYLYASLHFTPSNSVADLSMDTQVGVNITAAPVLLYITGPKQAVDGDNLDYVIDYKNLDVRQMGNVQIRVDFPQGFQLNSAQPMPSEKDAYWYAGNIDPNQGGKITIHGQVHGNNGDDKNVVVSLGHVGSDGNFVFFNKEEFNTHLVLPVLAVKQSLDGKSNDIIQAGDVLKYTIAYQNTGSIGLRDAIVTAEVKGKILDFSKLSIDKGSYDGSTGVITWKTSDVPGLANIAPNGTGEVHFSIPVKDVIPVDTKLDKNFVVSSTAKIDSPDIPVPVGSNKIIGSNELVLKLASKVVFDTRGYYKDAVINNSGPIPMQTGSETTFTIHWAVVNVSNDISSAQVVASLPSGVRWTGQIFPLNEKITYDLRTNQIIWNAGDITAGAGVLNPAREVEFQVGVTPQTNQIGQPIVLVNQANFTAQDDFADGQLIQQQAGPKDTQLYEDPNIGSMNGKVAQ